MAGRPRTLDNERIVNAAFLLLDEKGLDAFSLRQVAAHLDVHVSALYRHFKNREMLLLHLTQMMLAQSSGTMPPDTSDTWQDWLLYDARRLRKNLLSHRDGPRLCVSYHHTISLSHSQTLFEVLSASGFAKRDAAYCVSTIVNYIVGLSLEDNSTLATQQSNEFEYGLALLLEGMEHRRQR